MNNIVRPTTRGTRRGRSPASANANAEPELRRSARIRTNVAETQANATEPRPTRRVRQTVTRQTATQRIPRRPAQQPQRPRPRARAQTVRRPRTIETQDVPPARAPRATFVITDRNIRDLIVLYFERNKPHDLRDRELPRELESIPIGDWDVSLVTDMSRLFFNKRAFNEPLTNWNVSNVTTFEDMFYGCAEFNQPLNYWNVSNGVNMRRMFHRCGAFDQPLNDWNVSNVIFFESMFYECTAFNQPLDYWNVSSGVNMSSMFSDCSVFNQPLNRWNVSNVITFNSMFCFCNAFNQPLNNWIVSSGVNMISMFYGCSAFNQPLNDWDVSNIVLMSEMFAYCVSLDQPFNNWHLSEAVRTFNMFYNCPIRPENLPIGVDADSDDDYDTDDTDDEHVGVAFEVHNAFGKIDLDALVKIINPIGVTLAVQANTYVTRLIYSLGQMIDENSVFSPEEKTDHKNLFKSIHHKIRVIDFHKKPSATHINAILNYVWKQSPEFQKNYLASFIDQSVFAYGDRTNATQAELNGAMNNSTSSCPDGIRERLLISLRDGGFGLPDNREYQRIAAIIGNEVFEETCPADFKESMLLHSVSQCYNQLKPDLLGKPLDEKKKMLTGCVVNWLKDNHNYTSDIAPPTLLRLIDTFDDLLEDEYLEGGGKRSKKGKHGFE